MEGSNAFLTLVTNGLSTVLDWVATVINAIFGTDGDLAVLAPLIAIGISISALLLGAKVIRHFVWGM